MEEQGSTMPGSGLRLTFKVCYIGEVAPRPLGPLATREQQGLEPANWSPGQQGQG